MCIEHAMLAEIQFSSELYRLSGKWACRLSDIRTTYTSATLCWCCQSPFFKKIWPEAVQNFGKWLHATKEHFLALFLWTQKDSKQDMATTCRLLWLEDHDMWALVISGQFGWVVTLRHSNISMSFQQLECIWYSRVCNIQGCPFVRQELQNDTSSWYNY